MSEFWTVINFANFKMNKLKKQANAGQKKSTKTVEVSDLAPKFQEEFAHR